MEITYRIDKDILYVSINGRVDASNASDAKAKIVALKNQNADKHSYYIIISGILGSCGVTADFFAAKAFCHCKKYCRKGKKISHLYSPF